MLPSAYPGAWLLPRPAAEVQ
ncbi:hypothetical protein SMCF_2577, partial [Streptomyces coelicoflavus ZG0656]